MRGGFDPNAYQIDVFQNEGKGAFQCDAFQINVFQNACGYVEVPVVRPDGGKWPRSVRIIRKPRFDEDADIIEIAAMFLNTRRH